MPTLTKVACFCSFKGKIDFENLLLLVKMLKNLPLEQNIFSFTDLQLDWEVVGNNQGGSDFFKIFTNWGGGNKLKSKEKT